MLSKSTISDISELDRLKATWNSLASADPRARLCNSFSWVESWIQYYWVPDYILLVVVIKAGDRPVALLPLYFNTYHNKVMFLGAGEPEQSEVASEYLDFLIDAGSLDQGIIYSFIIDHHNSLSRSTFEFTNCLDSSHVVHIAKSLTAVHYRVTGKRFQIDLGKRFEEISKNFSKNHRKKSREIFNRFNNSKDLEFHSLPDENFERNWEILRSLHTQDWLSRGKLGAFSDTAFNQFHKHMYDNHPDVKQFFFSLTRGGKTISINHYYQFKDTVYFYATGSDKANNKSLSPGILLHNLCIASLSGQQLVYDFMKGAINGSYKQKFCKSSGCFYTITIYSQDFPGKIRYFVHKIKRALLNFKQQSGTVK
ncbi:MAG: GNAT family N-acetyltransferase [Opitutaceae bacterium]|nr:GNAT family N-acetyltransferase [Opitutaceae bacterium]